MTVYLDLVCITMFLMIGVALENYKKDRFGWMIVDLCVAGWNLGTIISLILESLK